MLILKTILTFFTLLTTANAAIMPVAPLNSASNMDDFLQQMTNNDADIFSSYNNKYQLIKSGFAIKGEGLSHSTNPNNWSKKFGNYQIIIPKSHDAADAFISQTLNIYAIAKNPRTQKAVIISGAIIVEFSGDFTPQTIANTYGITLKDQFPHLNLAFFTTPNNLIQITNSLKLNPLIKSANIEVIESFSTPN